MATAPNAMTTFTEPMMVHATDLNPFTANINDLYTNQSVNGFFSRYSMSNSAVSTAWTVATLVLQEGTGLGISGSSNQLILAAGIWEVSWNVQLIAGAIATGVINLSTDTTTTSSNPIIVSDLAGNNGITGTSVTTHIRSTGTAVLSAKIFLNNAVGVGAPNIARLTLMKEAFS